MWGHCAETESLSLAYLPLIQALDAYASGVDTAQLEADLGSSAFDVARIVQQIRDRLGIQLQPSGDPEEDRWHLFQAVIALLRTSRVAMRPSSCWRTCTRPTAARSTCWSISRDF